MTEQDFLYFPSGGGQGTFSLQDPCVLDCPTEGETVTLTIDRAQPRILFISIGGEMRRCVDLSEFQLSFATHDDATAFLKSLRDSPSFGELIAGEESMNEEWDSL